MTPREQLAHDIGLRAAIHAARTSALTMETAPDAMDLRKQAAVAALYAFADAADALALTPKEGASCTAPGADAYDRFSKAAEVFVPLSSEAAS